MEILIVEDEVSIANSLKKNLQEENHHTEIALNGRVALEMISEKNFDLILLDWRIPEITGVQLCKKLRDNGFNKPIVLLTALSDISNKIEALNAGADDYITKPFSFEEVLARINAVNRRYSISTNVILFDGIKIDLFTRILSCNNIEIKLTEKEFDLIKYFYDNRGQILNKEILCRDVWKLPFAPDTNLVEVTVKNLRKKMENCNDKKFIQTVYGEGYLFIIE